MTRCPFPHPRPEVPRSGLGYGFRGIVVATGRLRGLRCAPAPRDEGARVARRGAASGVGRRAGPGQPSVGARTKVR